MAIEDSHPLTIVPDLFDQLTPFERKQVLARWNLRYDAANRLVHPVTKLGPPESIARSVILDSLSRKYLVWLWLAALVAAQIVVWGVVDGGDARLVTASSGVPVVVAVLAADRWRRRRRMVTGYFATRFPPGPTRLPQRRRGGQ